MRVQGNGSPDLISIESYRPRLGYVEVRLRENINDISTEETNLFEYDEYTFLLPARAGLREEVEANLADWLATGRVLEVNQSASILAEYRDFDRALQNVIEE